MSHIQRDPIPRAIDGLVSRKEPHPLCCSVTLLRGNIMNERYKNLNTHFKVCRMEIAALLKQNLWTVFEPFLFVCGFREKKTGEWKECPPDKSDHWRQSREWRRDTLADPVCVYMHGVGVEDRRKKSYKEWEKLTRKSFHCVAVWPCLQYPGCAALLSVKQTWKKAQTHFAQGRTLTSKIHLTHFYFQWSDWWICWCMRCIKGKYNFPCNVIHWR